MYDAEDLGEILGLDLEEPLPDDLAAAFRARASRSRARKGQIIIGQGTYATDVYLIEEGKVGFSITSSNGRDTSLREMLAGRLFGELAALTDKGRSVSAIATTDNVLMSHVSGPVFIAFLNEVPGAGYWMAKQLAARVRHLTEKCSELATLPVAARIHRELLRLSTEAKQDGDRCEIEDFPTHAELAARIGSHREAVTRELGQLQHEEIVSLQRRTLTILSLSRLHRLMARMTR